MTNDAAEPVLRTLQRQMEEQEAALERLRRLVTVPDAQAAVARAMENQQRAAKALADSIENGKVLAGLQEAVHNQQRAVDQLRLALEAPARMAQLRRALDEPRAHVDAVRQAFRAQSAVSAFHRAVADQEAFLEYIRHVLATSGTVDTSRFDPSVERKKSAYVVETAEGRVEEPLPDDDVMVLWGFDEVPARVVKVFGPPLRRQAVIELDGGSQVTVPMDAVRPV